MSIVGLIANPAAGRDIRRLVSRARFTSNQEKINIIKRVLAGLDSVGIKRVVMMPDSEMLGRRSTEDMSLSLDVEYLDMTVFDNECDSIHAAKMMCDMAVGCLITLGGDGTNRAVAKGVGSIPLVPISTGTNNVFPVMVEGTIAGIAAGVLARRLVDPNTTCTSTNRLEVYQNGELKDIALVDVAISSEPFVGSRAIWDVDTVLELYLARAEPTSLGLSAIGAQLKPISMYDDFGIFIRLGEGGRKILAPIAPGMVVPVLVDEWSTMMVGEPVKIARSGSYTIALDGERSFSSPSEKDTYITLTSKGPRVVSIADALKEASSKGVFTERMDLNGV